MLIVKNLNLIKKKKNILSDINVRFSLGKIQLLVGCSGSGKTSLLRCLAQIEEKYSGCIYYENQNLKTISPQNKRRVIGFVSQSYPLFPHLSVLSNCTITLIKIMKLDPKLAEKKATDLLSNLGMDKHLDKFPNELSGGQQQRVAIARALVLEPQFLLLDEPTSALDPENSQLIRNVIKYLINENKGVIVSSHDMDFVRSITGISYQMEQGRIVAEKNAVAEPLLAEEKNIHSLKY